jgi:hypothetical protein
MACCRRAYCTSRGPMQPKMTATMMTGGGLQSSISVQSAITCIGAFVNRRCLVANGIRLGFSSTFKTMTSSTSLSGHNGEDYGNTIHSTRVSALLGWDPSLSCPDEAMGHAHIRGEQDGPAVCHPTQGGREHPLRKYVRELSHFRNHYRLSRRRGQCVGEEDGRQREDGTYNSDHAMFSCLGQTSHKGPF